MQRLAGLAGGNKTVLAGVPSSLPALIKAFRVQEKVAHVGFDWEKPSQVWDKVREELSEFESEASVLDADKMEEEMGDVFFAMVNAARLYGSLGILRNHIAKYMRMTEYQLGIQ